MLLKDKIKDKYISKQAPRVMFFVMIFATILFGLYYIITWPYRKMRGED